MNSKNELNDFWEEIELDENLIENTLELAARDLKTAGNILDEKDYDWAFSISYNAMLQAGRALMFAQKLRPKGEYKHVSVIEFVKTKFNEEFGNKVLFMFNKIRKKRHIAVYEQVNIISKEEAENAFKIAKEFFEKVKELIEKQNL